jgi:GNAT superfamily N-acetyltransferase
VDSRKQWILENYKFQKTVNSANRIDVAGSFCMLYTFLMGTRYPMQTLLISVQPDLQKLSALHGLAFAYAPSGDSTDAWARVLARSLCWVTAHDQSKLVGFVNVAWDGGLHAFLLDTAVHPGVGRQGLGTALVKRAAQEAARLGAHWLHVDYEPHLESFYQGCGFTATGAGLLRLTDS